MTRSVHYLAVDPDDVIVHLHEPGGAPAGPSVVIVPPFGWEDVASHRARRAWADHLAERGSLALRLDLPGTGDSAGSATDPGRVPAWIAAVTAAAAWLRARAPERRVTALGLGQGGLVAWAAAADGAAIDDLVLWAVPARGRTLVRELKAFAALKADEWGEGPPPPEAFVPEDGLDVAGYLLTDETVRDLAALDLTQRPLPAAQDRRVLLLGRDGLPPDARLAAAVPHARTAEGPGWGVLIDGPQRSRLPGQVVATVDGWLADGPGEPLRPVPEPPASSGRLALEGTTEAPWTAPRSFGAQFGILASGEERAPLGVLLLNGGAVRHTGPNRMWVEAARRWAAQGIPVLRLDVEGLGDSDGDERPYRSDARLHDLHLAEQARQTITDLLREQVAASWLPIGLCAGGLWAFHALLDGGEDVPAAVAVNPFALYWEDELVAERDRDAVARLAGLDGWKRVVSGGVSPRRAAQIGRSLVARRRRPDGAAATRTERELAAAARLQREHKRLSLLIGQGEPIAARMEREGTLAVLQGHDAIDLRRLPSRDHTFRAPWQQRVIHAELDRVVAEERALRAGGSARPVAARK